MHSKLPVQVDKLVVDVEIADTSFVVAILNLELVGGRWQSAQLQRSRQVQEPVTRFGELGTSTSTL